MPSNNEMGAAPNIGLLGVRLTRIGSLDTRPVYARLEYDDWSLVVTGPSLPPEMGRVPRASHMA